MNHFLSPNFPGLAQNLSPGPSLAPETGPESALEINLLSDPDLDLDLDPSQNRNRSPNHDLVQGL